VEGAQPPPRGFGGCAPRIKKEGVSSPPLQPRHEWGPKPWQTLSLRGWANEGSRGAKPPWRGLWGVSPHKFKRGGEAPTLTNPPRVGPKTLANPQPTGWVKRGSRGPSHLQRVGRLGQNAASPLNLPAFGDFLVLPYSIEPRPWTRSGANLLAGLSHSPKTRTGLRGEKSLKDLPRIGSARAA